MSLLARLSPANDERATVLAGIALMLLGVFMFAFGDALGKYLVATYPVGELLFLRALLPLAVLLALIARTRASLPRLEKPALQVLRMVLSTAEVAAFFISVKYLPLADVITCYLACPIFVTAGSALLLKEQVGWRRWSAVGVGFVGVVIAVQPGGADFGWPWLIALGGSLSFAALMIVTRHLRGTPDIVLAATQFAGTFTVGLCLSTLAWVTPSAVDLSLFFLAGAISIVALLSVNRSLKLAPASVVVPYQYTMIVWAMAFGYVAFGDVPSLATVIGAAIIVAAGIYIFLREQSQAAQTARTPPPA